MQSFMQSAVFNITYIYAMMFFCMIFAVHFHLQVLWSRNAEQYDVIGFAWVTS